MSRNARALRRGVVGGPATLRGSRLSIYTNPTRTGSSSIFTTTITKGFNLQHRRFLSDNCGNCRYRAGCLALEQEAAQAERKRLLHYLLAAGLLPVAMVSATQGWEKVRGTCVGWLDSLLSDIVVGSHSNNKRRSEGVVMDLSTLVPDMIPTPTTNLRLCGCGCGKDAFSSEGYEIAGGALWLKEHFHCSACATPLVGKMRTVPLTQDAGDESWVFIKDGKLYCTEHYASRFCKRCCHCDVSLDNRDFLLDPKTGRAGCVSCHKSLGEMKLFDDHKHVPSIIHNIEEGSKLFDEVKHTLSEMLGLDFSSNELPLDMVDSQAMRRVKRSASIGSSSSPSLGLTVKTFAKGEQYFKPQKVLVLKGMSQLKTGSVMAHELMHCWLAMNVLNNKERNDLLPLGIEEGLCEFVAYLWLLNEKQNARLRKSSTGMEEILIELLRMENNDEQQQGLTFHNAFRASQGRTLRQFLSLVINKGQFPPPVRSTPHGTALAKQS